MTRKSRVAILIPGIFDYGWSMDRMKQALESAGFTAHYIHLQYNSGWRRHYLTQPKVAFVSWEKFEDFAMHLSGLKRLQKDWPLLTYYQKFESIVALVLTFIIGLIILVALFRLATSVVSGLLFGMIDPLDHDVFQTIFGEILTLLIALEFNHTLQYVVTRQQSIIQTSVVALIALLALTRKFIILDLQATTAGQLLGLAAVTLALALTYWVLKEKRSDELAGDT